MGRASQARGKQGEYELTRKLPGGGIKVSRPRKRGIDVVSLRRLRFLVRTWEVKRTKTGMKTLYNWIDQAKDEGADAVVFRMDGRRWLVVVELDSSLDALDKEMY